MFHTGQVVWDCSEQKPVRAYTSRSKRETHFIRHSHINSMVNWKTSYEIYRPYNEVEALWLMREGKIFPSPLPDTHCHKCFNWMSNHNPDGSCWERETICLTQAEPSTAEKSSAQEEPNMCL